MPLEHPPKRSGWPPTLQRLKVAALVAARGIWISITVRVATAGVLVISTPSLQARAQEVPNQALLSELLRVYQNRVEQMNPIWVKYKSSHIETAEFRALLRQKTRLIFAGRKRGSLLGKAPRPVYGPINAIRGQVPRRLRISTSLTLRSESVQAILKIHTCFPEYPVPTLRLRRNTLRKTGYG
jgi:hypothetical protein